MTPFHVGMKVVCVDDDDHGRFDPKLVGVSSNGLHGLTKYSIYTVRAVGPCPRDGVLSLWINEIIRPFGRSEQFEIGYAAARFRPAHENRMDELRTLLAPVPSKELVQS